MSIVFDIISPLNFQFISEIIALLEYIIYYYYINYKERKKQNIYHFSIIFYFLNQKLKKM
jgi:hypothetical protein